MEIEKEKMGWVEYDLFAPYSHIVARTFLRHGGISKSHYFSLNASGAVGDHPDCVKFNHQLIQKQMQIKTLVFAKQVHGTNVVVVDEKNAQQAIEADILVTKSKNIGLAITHADCQAGLFYDPDHEIIAAAHVGWKGLFQGAYTILLQFLKNNYKTDPSKLIGAISPSLCPKHSEFKNFKKEVPEKYWGFETGKNHFDLWAIAKKQLTDQGMSEKNIEFALECTFENANDYFSYRREQMIAKDRETGRNASVIAIMK